MSATISSTAAAAASVNAEGTGSRSTAPRLSADLGTFLTLLTTQLRNQDPTKPMDTEALTQQLVQFATVEQQISGNQTLEQMLALQQAGQLADTAALVGRRVTLQTDRLPLQDGRAEVVLPAAGTARRAVLEVQDRAGTTLRRDTVALGGQPSRWTWDGRDTRGAQRPDGEYRVVLTGQTEAGTTTPLDPSVTGRVTGAMRADGTLMLRLGTTMVGFDRIRELPNSG